MLYFIQLVVYILNLITITVKNYQPKILFILTLIGRHSKFRIFDNLYNNIIV